MLRVLVVLAHVRHTTFSYELAERVAAGDDVAVTVVSYHDASPEEAAVHADTDTEFVPLGANSRFDPAAIRTLRWLLVNRSYDILHTHHNFVGSLSRLLAPRGTTIVDTEHADHERHYSRLQVLANAATLPRANRVVANSTRTLDSLYQIERLPRSADRFGVIYNGIDTDRIDRAIDGEPTADDIDDSRITTVGRFSETKNHATLLRAFADVHEARPDSRLTLVGDGPLRTDLEALARSLGIRDAVEFTGFVDREEVYRLLKTSSLYVQPSISEGFCMAVVEAMACSTPVVVSDIDVFHEVVGDAGVFAPPTAADAFADRLRRLLADDDRRTELAERGADRARTRFSLDRTAEEYRDCYEGVLDECGPSRASTSERAPRSNEGRPDR